MGSFCTLPKIIRIKSLYSIKEKILAWSVHVFTALGAVAAFLAILAIHLEQWANCFLWLFVCLVIDGVDGTFARRFQVKDVLPQVDGKNIDFVIDFITYVLIPSLFFYHADMTSDALLIPSVAVMLISSALYYGLTDMVEDEQYFIGFPALWNVVVYFQFFILESGAIVNFVMILVFGVLHFVPLKFAYPSRAKKYFWWHISFTIIGLLAGLTVLLLYPLGSDTLKIVALICAIYFGVMSVWETIFSKDKNLTT